MIGISSLIALSAISSKTTLEHSATGWKLLVDGKPFFVKGVGGNASKSMLASLGGNSVRTWGAEELPTALDEAQKHGIKLTAGIWLGHLEHGFNYHDPAQVKKQFDAATAVIAKYKDHPALLMWAIGNEMEGDGSHPEIWQAVEQIAKEAKRIDPNHPTMTVIAELGTSKPASIAKFCPSVDIVGINSYGGGPSVGDRFVAANTGKPYIITEFGPAGQWETKKTGWGAPIELTSTAKTAAYESTYTKSILAHPSDCLGSYAFLWGNKQEATATWFGMLLPDGTRLGPTDALHRFWTGKDPEITCPEISELTVDGGPLFDAGAVVKAHLNLRSKTSESKVRWVLQSENVVLGSGGADELVPPTYADSVLSANNTDATFKLPTRKGGYRIFAYVAGPDHTGATANVPIYVRSNASISAPKPEFPFSVERGFSPSGWMGGSDHLKFDGKSSDEGKPCLKFEYQNSEGWFAVAWQNPSGDWGKLDGGYDLSAAKYLTFEAKSLSGSLRIGAGAGLIKDDQPFSDTAITKAEFDITGEWKTYRLDLAGLDLRRIKTGFVLSAAASGKPVTILLRNIAYVQK